MNQINYNFSQDGLIFICKKNEYYKNKSLKFEEILCILNALESNIQFKNLGNRICYISCCLYLLTRYDEKYISEFSKKIIGSLNLKENPLNDTYLFLIFNCIDFDENFLHSNNKRLQFLHKYLERFAEVKKTKQNYLLYKYYKALLLFRMGNTEEALNESFGIVMSIDEDKNKMTKELDFIKLKNNLFQIKVNESNNNLNQLRDNFTLLKDVYERVKNENPFLSLKIGLDIYNNLYNQNLFNDCIKILDEMNQIIKNYERQNANPKKLLRFKLSIFCRYGLIGLLLSNKEYVDFAINEMNIALKLIGNDLNNKKTTSIFRVYFFAWALLKMNSNVYVDCHKKIADGFTKEFVSNKFNEGKYVTDNYLITNNNINQCIINLNSINRNLDISMNDKAQKIINYYIQNVPIPGKNLNIHDAVFTFIIGLHDRIRYYSESYLTVSNKYNQEKYKYQILSNSNHFWNYINQYADAEPLLKTDFFKSIIIKIYSCCSHVYYYNKEYNKISSNISYFDNLSQKLNINENTPSYELVWKVKGDYYYKSNDYNSAISCYQKSANIMNDKNPKKPVLYFNLGVLYYYTGDKRLSIENLQKAGEYFKKAEEEKTTFDFHKRNHNLTKKYNLTQYFIKEIQNN